jgi:8-oxo-dGTP pyrophosphatase MutT (NUDIX family)
MRRRMPVTLVARSHGGWAVEDSPQAVELHSAGGVVWRRGAAGAEVLLIHRRQPAEWRLPKGKVKRRETQEQAAVREVLEETGVRAEVQQFVGATRYRYQEKPGGPWFDKRVAFYLIRPLTARVHAEAELDAAGFAPVKVALRLLTFDNERDIVRRALHVLAGHGFSA